MSLRKEIQLVFQIDEFFKRSKSGAIWGTVYFQSGDGQAFPDERWTDIVSGFVRAWLGAIVRMAHGISSTERVQFYDGPMEIELNVRGVGVVELVFYRKEEPQLKAEAAITHLVGNSVSVAEKLLTACDQRQWNNADTVAVRSSLGKLSGFDR